MPKGQWTILQFKHTPSTTHQSTNLCISLRSQGQGQNSEKMFTTDQESQHQMQQCHQESHSSALEKHHAMNPMKSLSCKGANSVEYSCRGADIVVWLCLCPSVVGWQLRFSLCSGAVSTKGIDYGCNSLLSSCPWLCGVSYSLCLLPRVVWSVALLCISCSLDFLLSLSSCVLLKGTLLVQGFGLLQSLLSSAFSWYTLG